MRKLSEILEDIKVNQATAVINLDEYAYKVRVGLETSINQAREMLVELMAEYKQALLERSVVFVVNGDKEKAKEFVSLAVQETEILGIESDALYKRLADSIEPMFGPSRTFFLDQISTLYYAVNLVANDLGKFNLGRLDVRDFPVLKTFDDTVAFVKELVRSAYGDELNKAAIESELTKLAVNMNFKSSTVPVILLNATKTELETLLTSYNKVGDIVELKSDTEVDKEFVINVFNKSKKLTKQA